MSATCEHPLFARAWTSVLGRNAMGWSDRADLVDGLRGRQHFRSEAPYLRHASAS